MTKYEQLQEHLKSDQNTWLVTGVAGFIGSNLLEKLLILNQKVVGLDNFDTGYQHNINQAMEDASIATGKDIKQLKQDFIFIEGDIRQLEDCQKACSSVDYVLHQAALGSVPRSIEDPINTNNFSRRLEPMKPAIPVISQVLWLILRCSCRFSYSVICLFHYLMFLI